MFALDKFKIVKVEENSKYGKFEIGPLPKGFGHTIGNPIRRILLTSISGAAVTSVKISGVKHEYSTLEGMQDDVLTFMLNLKNLALKSYSDDPVVLNLKVKASKSGVTVVKAGDIETTSDVEILNPELVLAELTKPNASMEAEITVERGFGYSRKDESKRTEVGMIPIDSIFSPVKHVSVDVVKTRVGQQTDLDQINLEIHTNGAANPKDTLLEAVEIFDLMANRLVDVAGGDSDNNTLELDVEEKVENEPDKVNIVELGLSTRLMNSLLNAGITDLHQLEGKSRNDVMNFKGMGKKSYTELEKIIEDYDIKVTE